MRRPVIGWDLVQRNGASRTAKRSGFGERTTILRRDWFLAICRATVAPPAGHSARSALGVHCLRSFASTRCCRRTCGSHKPIRGRRKWRWRRTKLRAAAGHGGRATVRSRGRSCRTSRSPSTGPSICKWRDVTREPEFNPRINLCF